MVKKEELSLAFDKIFTKFCERILIREREKQIREKD
jgi:hypothetical protein